MRFLLLSAAILSVVAGADFATRTSCAHQCTQSTQLAQASAFCSSYEKIGVVTSTHYPHVFAYPAQCCLECGGALSPTRVKPAPFEEPERTRAPKTTKAPPPACLGTATSSACSCLSLTSSTSTTTYSSTLSLSGPFYAGVGAKGDNPYYLKNVEVDKAGTEEMQIVQGLEEGTTKLWLDQFGRLFDSNPPKVPYTLPIVRQPGVPGGEDIGFPELVRKSSPYNYPVVCAVEQDFSCVLNCHAPGEDTSSYSYNCQDKWSLSGTENCSLISLVIVPVQSATRKM